MTPPTRILLALTGGLATGIGIATFEPVAVESTVSIAQPIGTAWLHALQMTVVPLIISLVITGVAATAEATRAGRVTVFAISLFIVSLFVTTTIAALVTPFLLNLLPIPTHAAAALRTAMADGVPVIPPQSLSALFAGIVPTNVFAAAASDAFLSLIVFTLAFAFAVAKLPPEQRGRLIGLFEAIRGAMLILIGWILWLAPVGVFALAFVVGGKAGTGVVGALIHYIAIISSNGCIIFVLGFLLAAFGGRVSPARLERAALPAQVVAASTQSSLASLPALLKGAEAMGIPESTFSVVLPLSVTMFRATQPAMNLAVAIYIANLFGIALTPTTLVAGVIVAVFTSLGSVSLPAQITFFASIAPVVSAIGAPIAPLGLLIAVETIPDIFRTVANINMHLAVTATIGARIRRRSGSAGTPVEA